MTDIGRLSEQVLARFESTKLLEQQYSTHALQRELLKAYDQLPYMRIQDAMSHAYIDTIQQRLHSLDYFRSCIGLDQSALDAIRYATQSFSHLSDMEPHLDILRSYDPLIVDQLIQNQRRVADLEINLHNRMSEIDLLTPLPHDRIAEVLARISVLSDFSESYQPTADFALKAACAYQHFADHQLRKALTDSEAVLARRMTITDLAGDFLEDAQTAWELMGRHVDADLTPTLSSPELPNIYKNLNQQLAYLYRDSTDDDPVDSFDRSTAATVSTNAEEIIDLIFDINELVAAEGSAFMFKPTNRGLVSTVKMTTTVADNQTSFAEIVDALYFLLYEGSGDAKRLTEVISQQDLEILWWIKKLRRSFRHDLDHGPESKSRKQHIEIGEVYRQLIGNKRPTCAAQWSEAQVSLYDFSASLLRRVLDVVETRE